MPLPFRSLIGALATIALLAGCKKEFDSPPVRTLPQDAVVTIKQLRALFQGAPVHFSDTAGAINSVFGVVTADEQDGNLYKNVYIQDDSAAIIMRLRNSGGLYRGDRIRVYLPGCVLSSYQGMLQLDSVDVDNNVVKQATGVVIVPETLTIQGITPAKQGQLVLLQNVQFNQADTAGTWANAVNQTTGSHYIEDCGGGTIELRTSGFANYAGQGLPNGKGSMVVLVSQYQTTMQISLRSLPEVHMDGPRCGDVAACVPQASLSQDFASVVTNTNIGLECWYNVHTSGTGNWRGRVDGLGQYARCTSVSFDAVANETWLVSSPLTYAAGMHLALSSIKNSGSADGLSVWVSTDLTNGNVSAATWTEVTGITLANGASALNSWVGSGNVDLAPFVSSGTFVVAIKYTGDPTNNTAYGVDNIAVN